jgi:hypothetical protein
MPFISINQNRDLLSELSPLGNTVFPGQPASITVKSSDSSEIFIYRGREEIGSLKGSAGRITLDVEKLGSGPITLQAVGFPKEMVGTSKEEMLRPVFGRPITFTVARPQPATP